jgi:aquaporin Z
MTSQNDPRVHYREYLIEAFCLGIFMVSACLATALFEHPASPLHRALPDAMLRRGLIGLAMGLTAIALIYSGWGKRSGAHMNPSVTLAFWWLGKIKAADALAYMAFQFLGGWLGVVLSGLLLQSAIADPSVAYAVTVPGTQGVPTAWGAEFAISFLLMAVVLWTSNRKELAPWTGVFAGSLVALYILIEAPYSGMSMNPARTLGSAVPARNFHSLWIYFTAPPLAMMVAAETYRRLVDQAGCAKLIHTGRHRCIFCGHKGAAQ